MSDISTSLSARSRVKYPKTSKFILTNKTDPPPDLGFLLYLNEKKVGRLVRASGSIFVLEKRFSLNYVSMSNRSIT